MADLTPDQEAELTKEVREKYDTGMAEWAYIRSEGDIDMRFLANDPWDPKEKRMREDAGRPVQSEDQLNQYTNQITNDLLINKRDVKVDPIGSGANDETARVRGELIRNIHYESKADDAHQAAVESAVQRSYGVWGLLTDYDDSPESFDEQKIIIRRFPNPNVVMWDLECKEADFSDMAHAFVINRMTKKEFKEKYPGKEAVGFSADDTTQYPRWFGEEWIQVAEYWKRRQTKVKKYELATPDQMAKTPTTRMYDFEFPKGVEIDEKAKIIHIPNLTDIKILRFRDAVVPRVTQYITNGKKILETNPWSGSWIPLFPVVGKELFVDFGGGAQRLWMSLIRLARPPQMRLNFARTAEIEVVGMAPKTKWVMYEGQIEGHEEEWRNANRNPITALQVKATLDATGTALLPLPERQDYEPPIQNLETMCESAQRAIQSAVGMYNSSVGKHDTGVRSGIAIDKLDQQSDVGSFHFTAALDRALEHEGRCINELVDVVYDTPRDVGLRNEKGEHRVARVNQPSTDKNGNQYHYPLNRGRHLVNISTGPSFKSQRDEAAAFADRMAEIPGVFEKIGYLIVKLKNLGPIGDEIMLQLTPPDAKTVDGSPAPGQLQAQVKQAQQVIDALKAELQKMTQERDAKVLDLQTKKDIAQMQADLDKYKADLTALQALEKISSDENLTILENKLSLVIKSEMAQLEAKLNPPPPPAATAAQQ